MKTTKIKHIDFMYTVSTPQDGLSEGFNNITDAVNYLIKARLTLPNKLHILTDSDGYILPKEDYVKEVKYLLAEAERQIASCVLELMRE